MRFPQLLGKPQTVSHISNSRGDGIVIVHRCLGPGLTHIVESPRARRQAASTELGATALDGQETR